MDLKQLILLPFCLLLSTCLMAQGFEGVVTAEHYNASADSRSQIKWELAPGKVALTMIMKGEQGEYTTTFIARKGSNKLHVLSATPNGKKLHHPIPVQEITPTKNFPDASSFEVREQDQSKTIAGYNCTKVAAQSPESKTIAWVAKGIDFPFYKYAEFFKSDYNLAILSQLQIKGIPLQSVTTSNRGLIIESVEVQKVQEKSLAPSVFEVPNGYKTVDKATVKGRK